MQIAARWFLCSLSLPAALRHWKHSKNNVVDAMGRGKHRPAAGPAHDNAFPLQEDAQQGGAVPQRGTEKVENRPGAILDVLRLYDGRVIPLPAVMGVLNVTPDSFSDGGRYLDPDRAAAHALEMEAAGAAIIDIGAESTRPWGAREVSAEVELGRLLPVLQRLH